MTQQAQNDVPVISLDCEKELREYSETGNIALHLDGAFQMARDAAKRVRAGESITDTDRALAALGAALVIQPQQ